MHEIYLSCYVSLDRVLSLDLPMVYFLGWQGIKLCLLLVPYLFGLYSQGGLAQQLLVAHFGAFVTSLVFLYWLMSYQNAVWRPLLVPYCLYSQWGMA